MAGDHLRAACGAEAWLIFLTKRTNQMMKTSPFQMPKKRATHRTGDRQDKATPDSLRDTGGATIFPPPASWLSGMSLPDILRLQTEGWLQDELDDARQEQDERGVRGLARLFSAASVKVWRIKIAMLLLGFPLPKRSKRPHLLSPANCADAPPLPESPAREPHERKAWRDLDNGSCPKW
jgi:hypothetical protein